MKKNENLNEVLVILLASIVLSLTVALKNRPLLISTFIYFLIIITANTLVKKLVGYLLEIKVTIKFWSWYQFAFRKDGHFKAPIPMLWLPLFLTAITKGLFWWMPIIEFDVDAKTERVSRRHGLYRFTNVTEWHIMWITLWGIATNIILAIIGYIADFEFFAKLSIFYAVWCLLPISNLDGSKIFFRSRAIWMITSIILAIFLGWSLTIVA